MEGMCSLGSPKRPRQRGRAMYLRERNVWLNGGWRSEMVRTSAVRVRGAILYSAKDVWLLYVNCSIQFSACSNRETSILTLWQTSVLFVKSIASDPVETAVVCSGEERGLTTPNQVAFMLFVCFSNATIFLCGPSYFTVNGTTFSLRRGS